MRIVTKWWLLSGAGLFFCLGMAGMGRKDSGWMFVIAGLIFMGYCWKCEMEEDLRKDMEKEEQV